MRRPPFRDPEQPLGSFGDLLLPEEAVEPILSGPVRGALTDWLTEIWAREELLDVGLKPRSRALFHGPPGGGKTTLAHHLAARIGLPLLAVRPERIIDCWIGSTGRNIGALFDAVRDEGPVVLFMDEFEALGGKRQAVDQGATQERNSSLDVMLQRIEAHDGPLIVATNLPAHLDPAIWRRFDIHIELKLPGQSERERILARYLAPFGLPRSELVTLAQAFDIASPALMRQWCEAVKRQMVLGPKVGWPMARDAVVGRVLAAVGPHPDLGKPRLWSLGIEDAAVRGMGWPLRLAAELPDDDPVATVAPASRVVTLGGRSRAT